VDLFLEEKYITNLLYLYLSISVSIYLSVYLSISMYIYLYLQSPRALAGVAPRAATGGSVPGGDMNNYLLYIYLSLDIYLSIYISLSLYLYL